MIKNGNNQKTNLMMTKMLDEYNYQRPKKGQFIDAEIMLIEHDRILVDLGAKTDALVPPKEFKKTDQSLISGLSEGDIVPVFVLRPPALLRKPLVSLQRGAEKADWDRASNLLESKEIVRLKVIEKNKGGLLVKLGNITGFLPASLMPTIARAPNKKAARKIKTNLIGEQIDLTVIEVNPKRKRLIFSARESMQKVKENILDNLQIGDVRKGIVVNLVDFGAFIDLLGIDGLLHISEIGWKKPNHPSDVLNVGDKLEVKILKVDRENEQVGLSRKALIDPFNDPTLIRESTK